MKWESQTKHVFLESFPAKIRVSQNKFGKTCDLVLK